MRLLMAIGILVAACGAAVPLAPPPAPGPVFCFAARVHVREGQALLGCADSAALCRRARVHAARWAAIAGVLELGTCTPMLVSR